jgi:hypothetical protein
MFSLVDDRAFMIGSSPSFSQRKPGLYQAEVTALVSVALVVNRLVAAVGSVLIVWRLVFILLEKTGITLSELCRMVDLRVPTLPRSDSIQQAYWSFFAMTVIMLIWPSSVAAPLATSSLQWIPSTRRMQSRVQNYTLPDLVTTDGRDDLAFQEDLDEIMFRAALMSMRDLNQAFNGTSRQPQRRFLYLDPHLPQGGFGMINMPYFEVSNVRWVDWPESSTDNAPTMNASLMTNPPSARKMGTLGFWKSEKWKFEGAHQYKAEVYEGKRNVSILVGRLENKFGPESDLGHEEDPCQNTTGRFGILPENRQHKINIVDGESKWVASDCWLLAEVTIRAGLINEQSCDLTLIGSSDDMHIAVPTDEPQITALNLKSDPAVLPTLDAMTDVLRQLVIRGVGKSAPQNNVSAYLTGMLTTAYYSTHEAMVNQLANNSASILIVPSESVILAFVERGRLYGWFAMNACLAIAALLLYTVWIVAGIKSKVVREPTFVALTMDLNAVCHCNANGLCNAVALKSGDRKLGKMVWDDSHGASCRRVRYISQVEWDENVPISVPLLPMR